MVLVWDNPPIVYIAGTWFWYGIILEIPIVYIAGTWFWYGISYCAQIWFGYTRISTTDQTVSQAIGTSLEFLDTPGIMEYVRTTQTVYDDSGRICKSFSLCL